MIFFFYKLNTFEKLKRLNETACKTLFFKNRTWHQLFKGENNYMDFFFIAHLLIIANLKK